MNLIRSLAGVLSLFCLLLCISCSTGDRQGVTYYFDAENGSDANPGNRPDKPFRSLAMAADILIGPGDSILLRSGCVFTGSLKVSCKGSATRPVVIASYGGSVRPHVEGGGSVRAAVHLLNCEYTELRDLEISNRGESAVPGLCGVLLELADYGTAKGLALNNLFIHDVFGSLVKEEGAGSAVMASCYHEKDKGVPSRFDGLEISNCHILNCQRNGIMMWGNWERFNWFPSLNVVISHNLLEGVPGDGIVPAACHHPVVEYNVMRDCPATLPPTEACDGIWPWSCDSAIIRFNVVSGHRSEVDGYGFDSDWNSSNSVFMYNLSYNNDGGFMLICNSGGWTKEWSKGNTGTIVKYNVSINDGLRNYIPANKTDYFSPVIHCTGPIDNTLIEKNLFILMKKPGKESDRTLICFTDWNGQATNTVFRNNYIRAEEPWRMAVTGLSVATVFENNLVTGSLLKPESGFLLTDTVFNRQLWYDPSDANWDTLITFILNKTIVCGGQEMRVPDLIGPVSRGFQP